MNTVEWNYTWLTLIVERKFTEPNSATRYLKTYGTMMLAIRPPLGQIRHFFFSVALVVYAPEPEPTPLVGNSICGGIKVPQSWQTSICNLKNNIFRNLIQLRLGLAYFMWEWGHNLWASWFWFIFRPSWPWAEHGIRLYKYSNRLAVGSRPLGYYQAILNMRPARLIKFGTSLLCLC